MRTVDPNRHALPFALALVAGALFAPAPVHGVTLGDIASLSSLGQPLRVVIPVALSTGEALNLACVKLVADNSGPGMPQIVTGRVSLEQGTTGPRLLITTPKSVSEPVMHLSVQTGCGSTTRRDYVLLLDPPNSEVPAMLAAADIEDPPWVRNARENSAVASAPSRQTTTVAAALPRTTWGTPIATGPTVAEVHPRAPEKIAAEPKPAAPVAVVAPPVPRELVAVSNSSGVGGFISEAGAANLPVRTTALQTTSPQSLPLTQPTWRVQPKPAPVSIWNQVWPYAAAIFGSISLVLVAFAAHRRHSARTLWLDPKSRMSLKGDTQAGATQATFASFGELTAPDQTPRRVKPKLPPIPEASAEVSELDTLLQDIQADMIDERTVKEAWKAAAGDSPLDMGSDSILKAIAAAERDLQIGAPEPAEVAMDNALEKELLTIPHSPMKVRFG